MLQFYGKFPENTDTRDFAGLSAENILPGSYVLINENKVEFLHKAYGYVAPLFYKQLPTDWQKEWFNGPVTLYKKPKL